MFARISLVLVLLCSMFVVLPSASAQVPDDCVPSTPPTDPTSLFDYVDACFAAAGEPVPAECMGVIVFPDGYIACSEAAANRACNMATGAATCTAVLDALCSNEDVPAVPDACNLAALCTSDEPGAQEDCIDTLAALIPICEDEETFEDGCIDLSLLDCLTDDPAACVPPVCIPAPTDEPLATLCGLADCITGDAAACVPDPCAGITDEPVAFVCGLVEVCAMPGSPVDPACSGIITELIEDIVCAPGQEPDPDAFPDTCIVPSQVGCIVAADDGCPEVCDPVPELAALCFVITTCGDGAPQCVAAVTTLLREACEGEIPGCEDLQCVFDVSCDPSDVLPPALADLIAECTAEGGPSDACLALVDETQATVTKAIAGLLLAAKPACAALPGILAPVWSRLAQVGICPAVMVNDVAPWRVVVAENLPQVGTVAVSSSNPLPIDEGGSVAVKIALSSTAHDLPLWLQVETSDSGEAFTNVDRLVFAPGETAPQTGLVVYGANDLIQDATQTVTIALSLHPDSPEQDVIDNDEVSAFFVNVANVDRARVILTAPDVQAKEAGRDPAVLRFTRVSELTGNLLVALTVCYDLTGTATLDTDFYGPLGVQSSNPCAGRQKAVIPQGKLTETLTILVNDDSVMEGQETAVFTLMPTSGLASPAYDASEIPEESTHTVAIVDDDIPFVSLAATDSSANEIEQDVGEVTVTRTGLLSSALTVPVTLSGTAMGDDYTGTIGTSVTIPAGQASKTITITPVDDDLAEGPESVIVTLLPSSDGAYVRSGSIQGTITILDDDSTDGADEVSPFTDRDNDGVVNFEDNCPDLANADQSNQDADNLGDACDPSPTGEPVVELEDSDFDGLNDTWETEHFGDLAANATDDPDGDGLDNAAEFAAGSDPNDSDSDDDGILDGDEGETPVDEGALDSDRDGLSDVDEIALGTDPNDSDSDNDGLTDNDEFELGTDPMNNDSDDDGVKDGAEVFGIRNGSPTDPLDPTDATIAAAGQFGAQPAFYVGLGLTAAIIVVLVFGLAGFVARKP